MTEPTADCPFPEGAYAGWYHSNAEIEWVGYLISCSAMSAGFDLLFPQGHGFGEITQRIV